LNLENPVARELTKLLYCFFIFFFFFWKNSSNLYDIVNVYLNRTHNTNSKPVTLDLMLYELCSFSNLEFIF
jgi:hypothetical protein